MTLEKRQRLICVLADYVMTSIAMLLFNYLRWQHFAMFVPEHFGSFMQLPAVIIGQIAIPTVMSLIFYLSGYYYDVVFRSRLGDLTNTLFTTLIGAFMTYFILLVNDPVDERGTALMLLGSLWGLMFVLVYPMRLLLTTKMVKRIQKQRFGYDTLIIGTSASAVKLAERLNSVSSSMGFRVVGFVDPIGGWSHSDDLPLPCYKIDELGEVISSQRITRLIVMPHRNGMRSTVDLLNSLFIYGLPIFISPTISHMVTSHLSFGNIKGEPLVNIAQPAFSPSAASIKRAFDLVVSVLALLVLLPFFIIIGIAIKIDSRGSIFYTQERVGYHKKPFKIIKFRSMRHDAEAEGPALSTETDSRITRLGHLMRRYRIDELPQFINVIKGEMSLVGPRPERQYYISQILPRAPYYSLIHQVRPGITSLGMVKFGYATTVDEMIQRMRYDILYLDNASLGLDLKILAYTFKTIVTGRGL